MIFDLTANSNGRKLPTIDPNYPLDQSVTFIKGNTASVMFEARISEDGRPAQYSYQWYLDGSAVSGAMSSSFQLNGISASGNHTIYCVITNAAGSVQTRIANLTAVMYYTPVLNSSYPEDKSVTFITGDTATATFEAKIATAGNPNSYTYQWYLNGTAISGATDSTYTWKGSADGTHTVYCNVTNSAGTVQTRSATLTVVMYYKPVLNSSYPANATVTVKSSVTCKVEVSTAGNPDSYTYQWYKDDSAVSGATGTSYTFTPTSTGSIKVYCEVKNAAGTVNSRTATITVNPKYLYKAGQTSGFTRTGKKVDSSAYEPVTPTLTYNSSNMTCEISTSFRQGMCYYSSKVSLANYSTLHFTGSSNGNTKICIWSSIGTYLYDNVVSSKTFTGSTTLSVSSLTGSYYIGFAIEAQSSSRKVTCTGLYLT